VLHYLKYRLKAKGAHQIHSPFVFDFYNDILHNKHAFYAYDNVENQRAILLKNTTTIDVKDFGKGSKIFKSNKRAVADIAKHVVKQKKYGQLLFRMMNAYAPKNAIELGTSLGISTLYLAMSNAQIPVHTFEGCPATLAIAEGNFKALKQTNIHTHLGPFASTLPNALKELKKVDFCFIDGHHDEAATLNYFELILSHLHNESIVVLDDINWSEGMQKAWKTITQHPRVTVSLDLHQMGIVFFRKEQVKEHFELRF